MEVSKIAEKLCLLKTGNICIAYNTGNIKEVWGYYLYNNQERLFIWTKYGKKLFDDYIINVDRSYFELGNVFLQVIYPRDCEIPILTSEYFHLINGNILQKIFSKKMNCLNNSIPELYTIW